MAWHGMALLVDLMNPKLNTVSSFTMQTSVQYPFHKSVFGMRNIYICIQKYEFCLAICFEERATQRTEENEWMKTQTHAHSQSE